MEKEEVLIHFVNCLTGEQGLREMTEEEFAAYKANSLPIETTAGDE
jgi:hypothetical protein